MKIGKAIVMAILLEAVFQANGRTGHAATLPDAETQISQKSGLPVTDVHQLLSNCAANQQSITFCAWRDRIEADDQLSRVIAAVSKHTATCDSATIKLVDEWKRFRDKTCATDEGDGSGAAADLSACQASMTKDYADHFTLPPACR